MTEHAPSRKVTSPVVLEMAITFSRDHSSAVVWMGRTLGGRRVTGRPRTVKLGLGSDALAGLTLSTALHYIATSIDFAAGQHGPARDIGAPLGATGGAVYGEQLRLDLPE